MCIEEFSGLIHFCTVCRFASNSFVASSSGSTMIDFLVSSLLRHTRTVQVTAITNPPPSALHAGVPAASAVPATKAASHAEGEEQLNEQEGPLVYMVLMNQVSDEAEWIYLCVEHGCLTYFRDRGAQASDRECLRDCQPRGCIARDAYVIQRQPE
jgi:hypothetical protein